MSKKSIEEAFTEQVMEVFERAHQDALIYGQSFIKIHSDGGLEHIPYHTLIPVYLDKWKHDIIRADANWTSEYINEFSKNGYVAHLINVKTKDGQNER